MTLSADIVDQQVQGLAERYREQLEAAVGQPLDDDRARSVAFVALCVKTMLKLSVEESFAFLTEGANDLGIDAVWLGEVRDGSFEVVLFQCKYHHASLEGGRAYPQFGVEKALLAIRAVFNLSTRYFANSRLTLNAELLRTRLRDGDIPRVRFLLCSNGQSWKVPEAQQLIDQAQLDDKTQLRHVSHVELVRLLQRNVPVDDTLRFTGKTLRRDVKHARVIIGALSSYEVARLMNAHGALLLEHNIRGYLGHYLNDVNAGISTTLESRETREEFFLLNNGITFTCDRFDYDGHQTENLVVRAENLQLINGAQTAGVIASLLANHPPPWGPDEPVSVQVRLLQLGPSAAARRLGEAITFANNSQTPVELKELHSNDELQVQLETSLRLLGYVYRRHRSTRGDPATDINIGVAAEAVLAIWGEEPHHARVRVAESFNKVYDKIFTRRLNAAQVAIAVLIWRFVEKQSKQAAADGPELLHCGASFVAMEIGHLLLEDLGCLLGKLTHRNFEAARSLLHERRVYYFDEAVLRVDAAVQKYQRGPLSQRHLTELFQRGTLLDYLKRVDAADAARDER